mmetsp:Transcript_39962/g.55552  ORF Transcript_39962/g.55552 Transcript_39962/m.55552 type:complete len:317 (+) Transcript_39962:133-1083(+)|eukprot:CAMPEP_0196572666 /NCGR_PEP_ID=MMETSP1081-20130531/2666_1 /TAXON_ID=36882 /ORGANISM="Pyramimonas amylifera, Strain CCMP720" /LENGTH=316 /DNA_ID=CAMNT_0041890053 /DNA_START=132 /DNA_END=1082 /DNA_ORIENTATION=-
MQICVKWSGKEFVCGLPEEAKVDDLKRSIEKETLVHPKRQKLLNLKLGGKMASDDVLLTDLKLKPNFRVMMMGTPEAAIENLEMEAKFAPEIQDDFDVGVDEPVEIKDRHENLVKLRRRVDKNEVKILNSPRQGKKLLVLDIDYTLFDHRSPAENSLQLMRPFLHEFLAASYAMYDIIIWSATGMKWVELKMEELGVLSNTSYKVVTLLDHSAMITVNNEKYGLFDCKPLAFIWMKFPEFYNENNTIMFDDLRRNFVMNPQNGLQIRPFRQAHLNWSTDKELVHLTQYLMAIGELEDMSKLNHKHWESYMRERRRE